MDFYDQIRLRQHALKEEQKEGDPPKITFKVYQDSTAIVKFAKPIPYDDDIAELINENRYGRHRIIDLHLYSEYQEEIDENLEDWQVKSMTDTRIELKIKYKDPK